MKADRVMDRFILVFVAVVLATTGYMAWVIHTTGYHWFHLYWMGLGVWGFYVLVHIESVFGACRDREFKALVDDWVRRGEPDEPLDLKR